MSSAFRAKQVSENVWLVSVIDWELTDFHGYATTRGTTYNAFIIMADKITLIDTVKAQFTSELLARIASFIHPSRIDYIVSNHAEPDHASGLPEIMRTVNPEKVFASRNGVKALEEQGFIGGKDLEKLVAVKTGDKIELGGGKEITFYETKMVHWPDSMFSFLNTDGILFANDAFGSHLASSEMYADEIEPWVLDFETKKYYANIFWPYANATAKAVTTVRDSIGLDNLKIIAPDHGPLYRNRSDIEAILAKYDGWNDGKTHGSKVLVVFDTMWGSTDKMARAITEGLVDGGAKVVFCPLSRTHRSDIASEYLDADAILIGSPNLHGGIFPSVGDITAYLAAVKPPKHKRIGAAFGSYGWSPASIPALEKALDNMGVEHLDESWKVKYAPGNDVLLNGYEFGEEFAKKLITK